jgi:hypothetical protein
MRRLARVCAVCGSAFTGTVRHRYCSEPCQRRAAHHRTPGVCALCGASFDGRPGQTYCSRRCAVQARAVQPSDASALSHAAIAARLREVDPTAYERLPPAEREALRSYYGLAGDERPTQAALAARLGLLEPRVSDLLMAGVARLLGPAAVGATARARRRPEAERVRRLDPAAFAALPEPQRRLVHLYYGLDGGTCRAPARWPSGWGCGGRSSGAVSCRRWASCSGRRMARYTAPALLPDPGTLEVPVLGMRIVVGVAASTIVASELAGLATRTVGRRLGVGGS